MSDEQTTILGEHISMEADELNIFEILSRLENMGINTHQKLKDIYVKVMLEKRSY